MALKLSFDVVNQSLVLHQGSTTALEFGQTTYQLEIRLVQPTTDAIAGVSGSYDPFDDAAYDGIRVGIWSDSTGTLDDSASYLLALTPHTEFTKNTDDPDDPYWVGEFNTYTTEVAAFLNTSDHGSAYFAVNLVSGSNLTRVFDHVDGATNCVINSATDDGSGDLPVSMLSETPTTTLPWHVLDPASGELYALTRTAAGTLTWVWINP